MTAPGPVVVFQTAFLGDVILTNPLLQVLAARHGAVDVITTPGAAALLEADPAVREVIRFDKHGRARGTRGMVQLAARLRDAGYMRAYLPHRSWRSAAVAWLAGIPSRVGFADAPARWLYTERRARRGDHEVDRLVSLAGDMPAPPLALGLDEGDIASAEAWMIAHDVPARFVAVAPGSIWGTKRWDKYAALAARLDEFVVVVGGPEDRGLGEAIVAAARGRSANAAGALPLRASAALIERASLLVTNDSAPMHLAQAVHTPTLAIFGPTVPAFGFGPRHAADRILEVGGLPCRPCSRHGPERCPLGHHRCMRDLGVDIAAAAVTTMLDHPS